MVFETKKVQVETLGEYLKAARQAFNLSLKQVSESAKVNLKWLAALEAGKLENLPADVYITGVLKQLAQFYRLDESALILQYQKERRIAVQITKSENPVSGRLGAFWRKLIITPKIMALVLTGLFVFLTLAYLVWQVLAINRAPSLKILSPQDQAILKDLSVEVSGQTDPGITVSVNGQEIFVDNQGGFKTTLGLSLGPQEILVVAKNRFDKQTSKSVKVFVQPQGQAASAKVQLNLNFTGDVLLSYSLDSGALQEKTAKAGEKLDLAADGLISLTVSDGGAVSANLNGQDLGPLGKPGEELKGLTFSPQSGIINK